MKNLSEKGLLVNLKISHWSGKKNDKEIAKDVETQHNTTNAGRYKKNLIDDTLLKVVHSKSAEIRRFVWENTMPWGDNGDRLLPTAHYMDFCASFRDLQSDFWDAVNDYLAAYPNLVVDAKARLKTMFRAKDYPTDDRMKNKFNLDVAFEQIANLDDFRIQVNQNEMANLKAQMEQDFGQRLVGATKDIWDRIKETVGHMVEKLSEDKPRFHDTMITNIAKLVELLPALNITGDPDIASAVNSMKSLVVDPGNLRNNTPFRNQKAKEAQAILKKFESYMD